MEGPKEFMVTKTSAERIGHLTRDIEHLPSQTDHRGLVRFEDSLDLRYISMIERLKVMAAAALEAPYSKFRPGCSDNEVQASE
jgi:hypothetical protein